MPWVKLDDGFYSNPKVIKAPPLARSLYVAGLCHCASGLTDGTIDKTAVPLLLAQTGAPRNAATALVTAGLWDDHGDQFEVRDYLQYNPSRDRTEAEREAAKERKAKQRARGRSAVDQDDKGRFVTGESQGESRRDTQRDGRRESQGVSPATRPVPSPLSTSSNNSKGVGPPASKPEEDQPPNPETPEARAQAAIEHMARCDLRASQAAGEIIKFPDAWLRSAAERRHEIHHGRLLAAATERPDASPVDLAEDIDPACGPDDHGLARALASAAKTEQLVAERAQARADRDRAREILAGLEPDDLAWLEQLADIDLEDVDPDSPTYRVTRKATLEALALEHHGTAAP
jgi:hypothetical protein